MKLFNVKLLNNYLLLIIIIKLLGENIPIFVKDRRNGLIGFV